MFRRCAPQFRRRPTIDRCVSLLPSRFVSKARRCTTMLGCNVSATDTGLHVPVPIACTARTHRDAPMIAHTSSSALPGSVSSLNVSAALIMELPESRPVRSLTWCRSSGIVAGKNTIHTSHESQYVVSNVHPVPSAAWIQ